MPKPVWEKALRQCADPIRARHYWDQLLATSAGISLRHASEGQIHVLAAIFSGSRFLSDLLVVHPEWILLALNPELLKQPRQPQGLRREIASWLEEGLAHQDYDGTLSRLRLFKQREMLRIAARDLARLGSVNEIIRELSDLADICLDVVYQTVSQQFTRRYGTPWHQTDDGNWHLTEFCLLGLGKLGGQELNYSSDVDVIFVYADEGHVSAARPRKNAAGKGMTNHQFFTRLAKEFITEITRFTDNGMLFRVDTRLRPEGESGPLVRSLQSYENYYAQWGQMWERMMLIKTRYVAGSAELGSEFLEAIQSFRYPRNLSGRILQEVAAIKDRIETEILRSDELDRNVKLGRGGIREIEFIAQTHQILRAGKNPFLQDAQTLPALEKIARYKLLKPDAVKGLSAAYGFLRNVEHRLQMENNLQTHSLPVDREGRERISSLMGFKKLKDFESSLSRHTAFVRSIFDRVLKSDAVQQRCDLPLNFDTQSEEWEEILISRSFRDVSHAIQLMELFVHGPSYIHISGRTVELARELAVKFLSCCPIKPGTASSFPAPRKDMILSDPDRVLARLDTYVEAYKARATLYETWTHNPSLFELYLLLFDRSEHLAEVAIRTPDIVDELQISGRLRRSKNAQEILKDLRFGSNDKDQMEWLRRYHQTEQMRIGLRDILGLADFEHNLAELSALADASLQYAVEVVQRKHKLLRPPFAILGLGKLGGSEINYGSDLDLIFVAEDRVENLARLQKYAVEVMELLSKQTSSGIVFQTDSRLRPDGDKGLLVNTLTAYNDYFLHRAKLWEVLAYTRIRLIAGNTSLGKAFEKLAKNWTDFTGLNPAVAAYAPDWKSRMTEMRMRIQEERTAKGTEALAIKTGAGGLMDAEFIAQMFALENGWHETNTLLCLKKARKRQKLNLKAAETLITNYQHLRHIEGILRRWSFASETVLPEDPAALYRVAVRCGFSTSEAFIQAVSEYRSKIREVYAQVFRTHI